jgi:hypothetical protein
LTFDFVDTSQRPLHPVLTATLGGLLNVARFTPPRSHEILSAIPAAPPAAPVVGAFAAGAAALAPGLPTFGVAQATVQHAIIADDFNRPVRELTLQQMELATAQLPPEARNELFGLIKRLTTSIAVGSVVFSEDVCVNTMGVVAEATTGRCLACDTHSALVQETEREKLRADLLKTKLASIASATAYGVVRSISGAPPGAVVQLSDQAQPLGETVTDSDGLYLLSAKGLAEPTSNLQVSVAALPSGFTTTSPTSVNFKLSDGPVQVDFVAT